MDVVVGESYRGVLGLRYEVEVVEGVLGEGDGLNVV